MSCWSLKCETLHAWSRIAVELVNDDALEINLSSADGIEVLERKIVDNTICRWSLKCENLCALVKKCCWTTKQWCIGN